MKLAAPYDYKKLIRIDGNGPRKYDVGSGTPLPSVTTILSATADKSHLVEWKARVGDKEAERIVVEASGIGNSLHQNLEQYILHGTPPSGTLLSKSLTNMVIKKALCNVDEVWGCEVGLYAEGAFAGTTDLVGLHKGTPAIMDFKNSLKLKKKEWITDYFCQLAAYGVAHDERYGTSILKGVVMIACRDGIYQEFIIEGDEFVYYQTMWCNKVLEYYTKNNL